MTDGRCPSACLVSQRRGSQDSGAGNWWTATWALPHGVGRSLLPFASVLVGEAKLGGVVEKECSPAGEAVVQGSDWPGSGLLDTMMCRGRAAISTSSQPLAAAEASDRQAEFVIDSGSRVRDAAATALSFLSLSIVACADWQTRTRSTRDSEGMLQTRIWWARKMALMSQVEAEIWSTYLQPREVVMSANIVCGGPFCRERVLSRRQ